MQQDESAVKAFRDAVEQVKRRRLELLKELRELDSTLKQYGIDPLSLSPQEGKLAKASAETKPKQKRKRMPAPSLKWLEDLLREGKKQQDQIVRAAQQAGFSGSAALALLRKHGNSFKSERAPRAPGQRGWPPMVWSLKG